MLIGTDFSYTTVPFEDEAEIERVVQENAELLFGAYALLIPQARIATLGGRTTIPDAIVIDFEAERWYLVEAERATHGTWEHIAPQVARQLTAVTNPDTRSRLLDAALQALMQDSDLLELLVGELEVAEIALHGKIDTILQNDPIVAIPIDEIPSDLMEWAATLRVTVKVWRIQKYLRSDRSDVLYSFPDELTPDISTSEDEATSTTRREGTQLFSRVVRAGLLEDGQTLVLEYGPRGQTRQSVTGTVRDDGIELDGQVFSPSYAAVACMQRAGSPRQTANGWLMWKTADGKLINEKYKAYIASQERAEKMNAESSN